MHRYLLFAGDEYGPNGGWDDYITSRPSIDECKELCVWSKNVWGWSLHVNHNDWQTDSIMGHWMHVVDVRTGIVVYQMTSFKMKENERENKDTTRKGYRTDWPGDG